MTHLGNSFPHGPHCTIPNCPYGCEPLAHFPTDNTEGGEIPADVIAAGNRFADLFGDGRQGYAAFDIAVLAIMEERARCARHAKGAADAFDKFGPSSLGSTAGDAWVRIVRGEP